MKRVLVASMGHESNSFNPIITGADDFTVIYGKDIFEYIRENDAFSGVIKTLQEAGYEVIPTVAARAVPNGEVDYGFYMGLISEIIQRAKLALKEGPIDAITLSLHGSMRVDKHGEAEGYLLEELRSLFPNIPIFSSLDMHATMSKKMQRYCNGFVGYKCAPHTDCFETGVHAAKMTIDALENGLNAKSAWVAVPILIAGEQSETTVEPMVELIRELKKSESKDKIMAASYLMGFPWSDNEDSSVAVFVVADGDLELAQNEAIRLAQLLWNKKDDFHFHTETYSQEKSLDVAFDAVKNSKLPIYLSDSGDNPTAGSTADCTDYLKLIIDDNRTDKLKEPVIYGGIYDPIAVKECEGKVGEQLNLTFGAKFDSVTTTPITTTGKVKAFLKNWSVQGFYNSDIVLFNSQGIDIVITQKHIGFITPQMFIDLGRDPSRAEIVVCKLGYLTDDHRKVAGRSIMALTKGSTNEDLKTLKYKKIKRPIFPLDKEFDYSPQENLKKLERTEL